MSVLSGKVRSLTRLLAGFGSHQGGGVAMIFGLALVPLSLLTGAALDYSRASDAQTGLAAAADAAALSAVTPTALNQPIGRARASVASLFNSNATAMAKLATNVTVDVTINDSPSGRTVTVAFQADVPTTIMRLGGWNTVPVSGRAQAVSAPPVYIDFHLLLDNTPSMGIAATPADISRMQSLTVGTPDGTCAFACHITGAGGNDNYGIARRNGISMRIDVVRSAVQQLTDTAAATAIVPGQFRMAINTFGADCSVPTLRQISSMTSNLNSVRSDANNIDLMTIPFQGYNNDQCTDFDTAFPSMNTLIGTPGAGLNSSTPQKVLFFVSDGVADAFYPSTCSKPTTGGRCQEPIKPADCQAIKDRGIKIAVLYTTYLPIPANSWYQQWIAPFQDTIGARMQACASPDLYFEVSPSQGIADAMVALFKKSVAQAKLSM